jgi:hypothetical protein
MTVYAIDTTGFSSLNLITNETNSNAASLTSNGYFTLAAGPFYSNSVSITHTPLGGSPVALVRDVDFFGVFSFVGATVNSNNPVHFAISIIDENLTGLFTIRYQAFGGDWIFDRATVNAFLNTNIFNPNNALLAVKSKTKLFLAGSPTENTLSSIAQIQAAQVAAPIIMRVSLVYSSSIMGVSKAYRRIVSLAQKAAADAIGSSGGSGSGGSGSGGSGSGGVVLPTANDGAVLQYLASTNQWNGTNTPDNITLNSGNF